MGEELAHRLAAFPVPAEFPGRLQQVPRLGKGDLGLGERQGFAVHLRQLGFGIEGVDVRDAAVQEEEDDPLGPGAEMSRLGPERIETSRGSPRGPGIQRGQPREGQVAEAAGDLTQEVAAGSRSGKGEWRRCRGVIHTAGPERKSLRAHSIYMNSLRPNSNWQ